MTPKEKCKELVDKYYKVKHSYGYMTREMAKECALILCDEIIKASIPYAGNDFDYWQQVKTEIEKL